MSTQVLPLEQISDRTEQNNLVAVTSTLAGLESNEQVIRRLMKSPVMRDSTMYQSIFREGLAQGLGRRCVVEGRALVLGLPTCKLKPLSPEVTATES